MCRVCYGFRNAPKSSDGALAYGITHPTQIFSEIKYDSYILCKYRSVKAWYIAVYEGIELIEIYKVPSSILEEKFQQWEIKLQTQESINNPKIPMKLVKKGEIVYTKQINTH
ncbi:hypothetical protein HUN01_08965 [Nostoc edaphicum CCNP1411]|uniref:Uncharacterized protein n=1 Tax=Nostoc edaphicum CCNP1411 TaxID=1472755 RepID=A0A7D7QIT1_9NOSO|nr:hypothetical protein HUN01_08965 [Nostoc edaphicum CCNP1411]